MHCRLRLAGREREKERERRREREREREREGAPLLVCSRPCGSERGAEADAESETGAKEVVTVLGQLLVAARITTASDEAATTAVPAQAPAPVGNDTKNKSNNGTRKAAPAPAPAPAPLTAEMLKSLKALAAQWKKAKGNKNTERKIQSQLDEWIDDGACAAEREEEIWAIIRR